MSELPPLTAEWLEADGLGGFAMGTVGGWRTRRYHGLLSPALTPPTGRVVLVAELEAWLDLPGGSFPLSSHRYTPDVAHPAAHEHLVAFATEPWPVWTWRLPDGGHARLELLVPRGQAVTVLRWQVPQGARLRVRPLLACRDVHALGHERDLDLEASVGDGLVRWQPDPGLPAILARCDATYRHEPWWFRSFQLDVERARGFDFTDDLASPGEFVWTATDGQAELLLSADGCAGSDSLVASARGVGTTTARELAQELARAEAGRREALGSRHARAADAYVVARGNGATIVAGYPWFTDWGRDTFIAVRGLCLATGRAREAKRILGQWAGLVSEGMLPNRFLDAGDEPEFNAVDASLWFVVCVHELLELADAGAVKVGEKRRRALRDAVQAILAGYERGTRYGIEADEDGLLRAGVPGVQLTWMDARVGDQVITPRIGKPVEVQALWINALELAGDGEQRRLAERARSSFAERFWNESAGCLHDVVDPDGQVGTADPTVRPNQVLAVGGLPLPLLAGERARAVVDVVEQRLWTPLGLRTLDPADPRYCGRYEGGPAQRDGAYHQGPAWPWLLGPFVEAWVRIRGDTPESKREAHRRFVEPLLAATAGAGLGHVPELADGDDPQRPAGCPFQAWSVGELIRLDRQVLAVSPGL